MDKDNKIKRTFWIYYILGTIFHFFVFVVCLFVNYADENQNASKWAGLTLGVCTFIAIVINVRSYLYAWWAGLIATCATLFILVAFLLYIFIKSKRKKTSD